MRRWLCYSASGSCRRRSFLWFGRSSFLVCSLWLSSFSGFSFGFLGFGGSLFLFLFMMMLLGRFSFFFMRCSRSSGWYCNDTGSRSSSYTTHNGVLEIIRGNRRRKRIIQRCRRRTASSCLARCRNRLNDLLRFRISCRWFRNSWSSIAIATLGITIAVWNDLNAIRFCCWFRWCWFGRRRRTLFDSRRFGRRRFSCHNGLKWINGMGRRRWLGWQRLLFKSTPLQHTASTCIFRNYQQFTSSRSYRCCRYQRNVGGGVCSQCRVVFLF